MLHPSRDNSEDGSAVGMGEKSMLSDHGSEIRLERGMEK